MLRRLMGYDTRFAFGSDERLNPRIIPREDGRQVSLNQSLDTELHEPMFNRVCNLDLRSTIELEIQKKFSMRQCPLMLNANRHIF
jgi:hypothetical protein